MKKSLTIMLIICYFTISAQENGKTDIKSLAPPNSPAFILMDISPSSIVVPDNIQVLAVQTLSAFSNENNTDSNFAIEFQPYWYTKNREVDFFEYNNYKSSKSKKNITNAFDYDRYDIFGDIGKKASISIAYTTGTFDVFEDNRSYISLGAKTRLIKVVRKNDLLNFKQAYDDYENIKTDPSIMAAVAAAQAGQSLQAIKKEPLYKDLREKLWTAINKRPLLAIDIASAFSYSVGDENNISDDSFGRFGLWLSADFAFPITEDNKNYIHIFGVAKYLRDGLNINPQTNSSFITTAYDYGTKIELELNKFSFAYEYLTRNNENSEDENRSIGTFRYSINNLFAITGGFGENFSNESGNNIALFGIQFGLDSGGTIGIPKL
ncbi:capsid protein p24 [Flavivirga amylovorans]|uniref:Capsid protein p24 n=1 Tax=Flavivirga amylovorans TaxID=870486 RepID=A0ABT8X5M5_9FLAO|nr:capsid protein p24 [Flavivirga amylovorans]MDO5989195.1 capsid protein p24 [Flavivirga amylovorans]